MPNDGAHYPNDGKPVSIGQVFNVEPVLIDGASLIYRWHCGCVVGVDAARDGAHELLFSADHPDRAALAAATISPGHYATCNAEGLVRLWAPVVFGLRIDGRGAAATVELHAAIRHFSKVLEEQSRRMADLTRRIDRLLA